MSWTKTGRRLFTSPAALDALSPSKLCWGVEQSVMSSVELAMPSTVPWSTVRKGEYCWHITFKKKKKKRFLLAAIKPGQSYCVICVQIIIIKVINWYKVPSKPSPQTNQLKIFGTFISCIRFSSSPVSKASSQSYQWSFSETSQMLLEFSLDSVMQCPKLLSSVTQKSIWFCSNGFPGDPAAVPLF